LGSDFFDFASGLVLSLLSAGFVPFFDFTSFLGLSLMSSSDDSLASFFDGTYVLSLSLSEDRS